MEVGQWRESIDESLSRLFWRRFSRWYFLTILQISLSSGDHVSDSQLELNGTRRAYLAVKGMIAGRGLCVRSGVEAVARRSLATRMFGRDVGVAVIREVERVA